MNVYIEYQFQFFFNFRNTTAQIQQNQNQYGEVVQDGQSPSSEAQQQVGEVYSTRAKSASYYASKML
jgi:hypothetical protein